MKKLFITLLTTTVFAIAASAQIQRGNVMMGADISNISFGLDKPNPFSMELNPKAALFIQDGVAIGGSLLFGISTPGTDRGTTITYGVSALGRYYGIKGADQVVKNSRFFAETTLGIAGSNTSIAGSSFNTNGLGFSFGPGWTYFVTPSIGLEALLKYNAIVGFGNSAYAHNLGLGVGFQIYLPGKSTMNKVTKDVN